jgi:hypothetical protein
VKQMRFARVITSLGAVSFAIAESAHGQCVSATGCICMEATAVLDLTVISVSGPQTTLSVTGVHAASDAGMFATELNLARVAGDSPGTTWLAFVVGGDIVSRLVVDTGGNVACDWTSPPFVLPAMEATQAALSADCSSELVAQGLKQPPCDDVRDGCGCGASTTSALLLAPAAFVLMARRRKRP